MTRIATMGTSSCATIAIAGFGWSKVDGKCEIERNENYLKAPEKWKEPENSVLDFYRSVLYPVEQKLGHSDEYPFEALMKTISEHPRLNKKFTIATLNAPQENFNDRYWPKQLEKWGFEKIHITKNSIGGTLNHIYVRDLAQVEMNDD